MPFRSPSVTLLEARPTRIGSGLIRIRRPFYGWYIVGVAFISLFIQASTGGFTFGIFLPAMSADLGWSRSTIVVGSSLLSITAALSGPVLGRIVDQRGPRLVLVVCILLGVANSNPTLRQMFDALL